MSHPCSVMQVKDLNAGTFGFVQLARDIRTQEEVAVKFIERGDAVRLLNRACCSSCCFSCPTSLTPALKQLNFCLAFEQLLCVVDMCSQPRMIDIRLSWSVLPEHRVNANFLVRSLVLWCPSLKQSATVM